MFAGDHFREPSRHLFTQRPVTSSKVDRKVTDTAGVLGDAHRLRKLRSRRLEVFKLRIQLCKLFANVDGIVAADVVRGAEGAELLFQECVQSFDSRIGGIFPFVNCPLEIELRSAPLALPERRPADL